MRSSRRERGSGSPSRTQPPARMVVRMTPEKQRYFAYVFMLLANLTVLIAAGVGVAIALLVAWGSWRTSTLIEFATLGVGGIASLIALTRCWRGLRWVWLSANGAALVVAHYALGHTNQQIVSLVGLDAFLWIAALIIPVGMVALITVFSRIDGDLRWLREPSILGPK